MKKETTAPQLDLKAFAQSAGHIEGHDLLSNYERLLEETQGQGADRLLNWSARGELRTNEAGVEQIWLHLSADVSLPLTCQRCLAPADIDVTINRSFRFVDRPQSVGSTVTRNSHRTRPSICGRNHCFYGGNAPLGALDRHFGR